MSDLGDGIMLTYFEDSPPMRFDGSIDGQCLWRILWWRNDWAFYVARKEEDLGNEKKCLYYAKSQLHKGKRPTNGTRLVVEELKELIRACVAGFRKEMGPRHWLPAMKKGGEVV